MSKVIGIDLGTTFSVAAYIENGKAVVIPSQEGGNLIPSVVAFTESGTQLVGKLARAQAVANPWQTIASIKRLMGIEKEIKLNGRVYSPQEISSFILSKVKREAEEFLGQEVKKAVITVPAYFNDNQRQATKDSAFLAGLQVLRIINEPTAAALAYGLHKKDIHYVLVWDLGGGTFDVSVLELGQGVFEVKAVSGNTHLGGDDWDQRIIDFLAEEFRKVNKVDVREDRIACQRLKEASEKAKKELSSELTTKIRIPFIIQDKDLVTSLSRAKFEELSKDLLKKLITPTKQALKDAKLTPQDIDTIVLVGGSTRMPAIQQLATEFFGKEPYKNINPDEAVAIGAAIQAGVLLGEVEDVTLVDVTPLSLGIETMGGIFTKIIERNTAIPNSCSQIFTTALDNQTQVDIHVLQGERAVVSDNISLGNFTLDNIPLAHRGEPQIEVAFSIDSNGILEVSALDLHTENQRIIKLKSSERLSQEQINKILEEAKVHVEEDEKRREYIRIGIQSESMLESAQIVIEKSLKTLDKFQLDEIERAIFQVKRALGQDKIEAVKLKTEELKKLIEVVSNAKRIKSRKDNREADQ